MECYETDVYGSFDVFVVYQLEADGDDVKGIDGILLKTVVGVGGVDQKILWNETKINY